jgi:hypothetical protein
MYFLPFYKSIKNKNHKKSRAAKIRNPADFSKPRGFPPPAQSEVGH